MQSQAAVKTIGRIGKPANPKTMSMKSANVNEPSPILLFRPYVDLRIVVAKRDCPQHLVRTKQEYAWKTDSGTIRSYRVLKVNKIDAKSVAYG